MQSLLKYARALVENNGVRFIAVCILEIFEDMTSSNFLSANSTVTYVRYVRVGKKMMKNFSVLPLLGKLGMDASMAKTIRIFHFDDPSFYISSEEDIFSMVQVVDAFLMNNNKFVPFYAFFL